jgi:hypothetical protein
METTGRLEKTWRTMAVSLMEARGSRRTDDSGGGLETQSDQRRRPDSSTRLSFDDFFRTRHDSDVGSKEKQDWGIMVATMIARRRRRRRMEISSSSRGR